MRTQCIDEVIECDFLLSRRPGRLVCIVVIIETDVGYRVRLNRSDVTVYEHVVGWISVSRRSSVINLCRDG